MGRHSAPDEADDAADGAPDDGSRAESTTATLDLTLDLTPRFGRHATPEERAAPDAGPAPDQQLTQRIAAIDVEPVPPVADGVDPAPVVEDVQDTDTILPLEVVETSAPPDDDAAARKAAEREAKRAAKAERKAARGARESDTKADLRLLRKDGAVRAQAIGAVIVAFLLYTLTMLVIGRTDVYALWIWIPIVVSGVLVGLVLDLAHRRSARALTEADPRTAQRTTTG